MRVRTLHDVTRAVGGHLRPGPDARGGDAVVRGVSIDSRVVGPGDVFVALHGEHVDGHRFVGAALAAGAVGAVVERDRVGESSGPLVEVDDPARALLALAADERSHLSATVIGITGSTGKTCTKDYTAAVLGARFRVVASPASFNNEIGLPLTILGADDATEALVCEMGSRGRGHIRMLAEVARPHVGVVTNVGVAHMELFGSPEALRDAKAELPEALGPDGAAVLNDDDPVVQTYRSRTRARTILFGTSPRAEVRGVRVELDPATGRAGFDLVTPGGTAPVRLSVPGEHMVSNALAAAAVGWVAGIPAEDTARELASAPVSRGRMETFEAPGGIRVVDDSYNANPTSMAAALKAASWMAGSGRCIAVLGHMAELGPVSLEEHERLGELLARLRIDVVVTVGPEARPIALGAKREGVEPDRILECDDVLQAIDVVLDLARPGDLILVKASRIVRLERLADALRARRSAGMDGPGDQSRGRA